MDSDLEHTLYSQFPKLFYNRNNDSLEDRDYWWGLEIGNGWYIPLYTLCYKIQNYIDYSESTKSVEQVKFTQIKEKFGDLRVYYTGGDRFIEGLVSMTEAISSRTCETCGLPGKLRTNRLWLKTLCDEHDK